MIANPFKKVDSYLGSIPNSVKFWNFIVIGLILSLFAFLPLDSGPFIFSYGLVNAISYIFIVFVLEDLNGRKSPWVYTTVVFWGLLVIVFIIRYFTFLLEKISEFNDFLDGKHKK